MKKTLSAFLAVLTLLTTLLASCSEQASDDTAVSDNGNSTADISEETIASETEPALAEYDFGGQEIRFFVWDKSELSKTEETGDFLDDAIYRKNRKIEEDYNVKFSFTDFAHDTTTKGWNSYYTVLESSILAGDNSINIAGGYASRLINAVTITANGLFHDLASFPEIDFTADHWNGKALENIMLGNKLYFASGNISHDFYDMAVAMIFSKKLFSDYGMDNIYDIVSEGSWTFDELKRLSKNGVKDVNNDGIFDENDSYGYVTGWNFPVDALSPAFGVELIKKDADGNPYIVGMNDKMASVAYEIKEFLFGSSNALWVSDADSVEVFRDHRAVISACTMRYVQSMRDVDFDLGIIPYPKWNEEQEDYRSYVVFSDTTAYVVPITADGTAECAVLEALSYYGAQNILPEYFEVQLKGKTSRDNDSEAMLDIIYSTIIYDTAALYSTALGTPHLYLRNMFRKNTELVSSWASSENNYIKKLEILVDALN